MSDFEEGFATGLLLGRKQGGGYRSDVFHDILENSDGWLDIPINDTYKYTLSLWCTERLETYNNGFLDFRKGTDPDSDDACYEAIPTFYRQTLYLAVTAWENDNAVYSNIVPCIDPYPSNTGVSVKDGVYLRYYWYNSTVYEYAGGTFSGDAYLNFGNSFDHTVHVPAFSCNFIKKTYTAVRESEEEIPEIILSGESTQIMSRGEYTSYTVPHYNGTFSDLSSDGVINKYSDIVRAIYAANGKTLRNARLMP